MLQYYNNLVQTEYVAGGALLFPYFFSSFFHTCTGVIHVDEYPSVEELSITHHSSFFMSQPLVIANNGDTTHVGLARKPEKLSIYYVQDVRRRAQKLYRTMRIGILAGVFY